MLFEKRRSKKEEMKKGGGKVVRRGKKCGGREKIEDAPERVGHGHKVEGSLGVDTGALPFRENESSRVLEETLNVLPSSGFETLARDFEEGRTKVEDVDGYEQTRRLARFEDDKE